MSTEKKKTADYLAGLDTEQRNPATRNIDLAGPLEIVQMINREDKTVADSVALRLDVIAETVEAVTTAFKKGGRLIYAGSGTSGRIGIVDAAECPPTFGTDPGQVIGLIAGGKNAVFRAQERAEDLPQNGSRDIAELNVSEKDVVCGLAASGRTPYVIGALQEAKNRGAGTALICCVSENQLQWPFRPDFVIDVPVGPEVITGSTRMKSATAQKMVCNMITTGAMIRLGKIFENVMVDLQLTNEKLEERAKRIIMMFSGFSYEKSELLLTGSDNHVKTALLMALGNMDASAARQRLERHNGFIRSALKEVEKNG